MGKYRMYEPYGYVDSNDYISKKSQIESELETSKENDEKEFASAEYDSDSKSLVFKNVDGNEIGKVSLDELIPDKLVESAEYDSETKTLIIHFTNGDTVDIPLNDLVDVFSAGDGLQEENGTFSVKVAEDSEGFFSVSSEGVKLSGVQDAIDSSISNFENEIQAVSEKVDGIEASLGNYATKGDLEGFLKEEDLEPYATNEKVEELSANTYSKEESDEKFATMESVDEKLEGYATEQWVEGKNYITGVDLSNYATKEELNAYAKTQDIPTSNTAFTNDAGFITQSALDDYATASDVETATNDMATKTWVGEQGFLTEHQDISNLATKDEVAAVDEKVDAIDLEPYAKTSDVNEALEAKADKTEIPTDFYTQEDVNSMVSQLLTRIENLESNEGIVVASDANEVASAPAGSNLVLTSTEAIQALTSDNEYSTLTIVGGNANNGDIKAKVSDKLTVDGLTINGDKGASNGRILISADTVTLKNVSVDSGSTAYNIFESSQNTVVSNYFTKNYEVSNMTVDNTELNHNILNIYTFVDDAVVSVKDSYFNLDADKSNVLRLSNYTNATGVTINFENVEWTYENAEASDWAWAGLIIYQPSSSDAALNGDNTKLATWKFNFKNCKYNGELVNSVSFGEHNQVLYGYNMNKDGAVSDISSIATVTFE